MINIAICDDDRAFTENVEQLLDRIASEQGIAISCEVFHDGSSLIGAVMEQRMYFDLVYLDIEMEDLNGIHTALALREAELPTLIVYLSGHEEYLKDLFRTEPFRFLSKPIAEAEFYQIFLDAYERIQKRVGYFTFFYKKSRYRIPFDRITCFESKSRVITIHLARTGTEETVPLQDRFYGKMNEIEKQVAALNGRFLRIHQSFLVNFDYIKALSASEVVLLDGRKFQVSEDRSKDIRAKFNTMADVKSGLNLVPYQERTSR